MRKTRVARPRARKIDDAYRDLVLKAPDAIIVVADRKVMIANLAAAALVGVSDPESLTGRDVLEFTPPELRDRMIGTIERLHEGDCSDSLIETAVASVDGRIREVELRGCHTTYAGLPASIVFIRDITDRRRTEHDLRTSESMYQSVVENMNEALVMYDAAGNVKFVNRQFCAMFDCSPSDFVGKPAHEIYGAESKSTVKRSLERRRRGLHDVYQASLKGLSGRTVFADVSAAPIEQDGKFAGSLALITNITDQRRAQEKLRKSEQRYQDLVDSSENFIASFDCDDRYTAANKALCNVLGLGREEILGRTLEEVGFPPEIAREWKAQMEAARMTGQTQTREMPAAFRRSPGAFLRRIVSPIYSDDGTLIGVSALSIDITEQKASEEKNQKLLRAIEEVDEVMFTTDPAGVITYVNPAFEQIYGYSRDEAVGQRVRIIRSSQTPPEFYQWFWQELLAGRTVRTEFINRRKDGQLVRMFASVSPIHGEDGRLNGFTAVQRDVTAELKAQEERRNFEQQLARAARMEALGTLAGGIAHDFNNILSIVLTHATLAEMSRGNPARIAQAIGTIKTAVNRGASLSRQILTFARKADAKFAEIDANRVVGEVGSMIREMFPRNIEIDLALDAVPRIRADADQLHQCLLNLAVNARDAMTDGGRLTVSTSVIGPDRMQRLFPGAADRDHVCVEVADTGHGMTAEIMNHIFEPFFTTKQVGKGSGLGLAAVYGAVKASEGWVDVSSEPGRGSSFRLYFPVSTAIAAETANEEPLELQRGSERLLVIDDEKEVAAALGAQLEERGYKISIANGVAEAMTALQAPDASFDVILSDLGMASITARDLIKLLRQTAPTVPLIPMTGYVDPELHKEVFAAGTQPILQKPFTIEQLLRGVRQALRSARSS